MLLNKSLNFSIIKSIVMPLKRVFYIIYSIINKKALD
jgi:hypothetical protein